MSIRIILVEEELPLKQGLKQEVKSFLLKISVNAILKLYHIPVKK